MEWDAIFHEGRRSMKTELDVDLLVIGGGMAGATAAAYAANQGAMVLLVEKAAQMGGSAVLSGGGLARPNTLEDLQKVNPGGDATLGRALVDDYDAVIDWIVSLGVEVQQPGDTTPFLGLPATARGIDIIGYIERCRAAIVDSGSWVVANATVEELIVEDGRVEGAVVLDRDGPATVHAASTILATGGFQNDRELRRQHLGEKEVPMLIRSNAYSDGAGLRLGQSAGAALTPHMDRFYGHMVPAPLNHEFTQADFVRLAMIYIDTRCVLLSKRGERFVDESLGYYNNSRTVALQPGSRALLIGDQLMRSEAADGGVLARTLGYPRIDRPKEAAASGAHFAEAPTLRELDGLVAQWGYSNMEQSVLAYNEAMESGRDLEPLRQGNRRPLDIAPFFAVEVQPSITMTFGGLQIDGNARVLDEAGRPIPGLYAAGGDAGGYYHEKYCGGLGMACVLARRATRCALGIGLH
jgi:succinate dehydrogenase/fumarate reductase flavoprotein subunit